MPFKRRLQAAIAALVLTAAAPVSAQAGTQGGLDPDRRSFTFLDTKTNSIPRRDGRPHHRDRQGCRFEVQVEPMQFSTLIASLTSNRSDIHLGGDVRHCGGKR